MDLAIRGTKAITDPDELEQAVEGYFQSRMATRHVFTGTVKDGEKVYDAEHYMKPPTTAGLALALNVDRRTLLRYLKGEGTRDPELSPALSRAWLRIAEWWEEALAVKEAATGARFTLEANFGYGKEDGDGGDGAGFVQNIIPPADERLIEAIPVWEEGNDDV